MEEIQDSTSKKQRALLNNAGASFTTKCTCCEGAGIHTRRCEFGTPTSGKTECYECVGTGRVLNDEARRIMRLLRALGVIPEGTRL